jgi:hypothetical protein
MRKNSFSLFIFSFSLTMMLFTISLYAEFIRDSSGVVVDTSTRLIWQDTYNDNSGEIKMATWQDALIYCEELSLGGSSDWRLPNINELFSIVDITKYDPTISSVFIHNYSSHYYDEYWSSTTYVFNSSHAWDVGFFSGYQKYDNKSNKNNVRCVRNYSK